jgi:protein TonB
VRGETLGIPLLSSIAVHLCVILIGSVIINSDGKRIQDTVPIGLIDLPPSEPPSLGSKIEAQPEIKRPPPPPSKAEKPKERKAVIQKTKSQPTTEMEKPEPPLPLPAAPKEQVEVAEPKLPPASQTEAPESFPWSSGMEGAGSEAGAESLFGKGDVGVVPGPGTTGGAGGTATSGLARGSGAPGLPAPTTPIKTKQQAKPIQTVRASYPPMALRAGLESDVTLKIEVDLEGKVTQAEITKSGGAGFDEEALKAVKRSRFQPAQRDGQQAPAEFIYVYRFRLLR